MTRRIRLACEACDYAAEMAERIPFALDAAGEAVSGVIAAGIVPAAIEMMDTLAIAAADTVRAGGPVSSYELETGTLWASLPGSGGQRHGPRRAGPRSGRPLPQSPIPRRSPVSANCSPNPSQ